MPLQQDAAQSPTRRPNQRETAARMNRATSYTASQAMPQVRSPTARTSSGTRPRPVVAWWRTSAALALVALVAGGCGHDPSAGPPGTTETTATTTTASRGQISPVQSQPLEVKGTGFQPGEKVALSAKGLRSSHTTARADSSGEFEATFRGLKNCDSVTVTAVGSKGSHAEFNLSQIACVDA
jgi:hypothetical protein